MCVVSLCGRGGGEWVGVGVGAGGVDGGVRGVRGGGEFGGGGGVVGFVGGRWGWRLEQVWNLQVSSPLTVGRLMHASLLHTH